MRRRDEDGFSLVELLVVVAVLGILAVVAIPTLAAAGDRAGRRAAEVDLHTAAAAALTLAVEAGGTFLHDGVALAPADLHEEEPALQFAPTASGDVIGVAVDADETTMRLTKYDRSGDLVELVLEVGRHLAVGDDDESSDAEQDGNGNGNGGQSAEHRRDADTPASGRRPGNGR